MNFFHSYRNGWKPRATPPSNTTSPAAQVSRLQLSQQTLGEQKTSNALLKTKALARLSPSTDGTSRHLDLLRALWLLHLIISISAAIPKAKETDEDHLQQQVDHLLGAVRASTCRINAVPSDTPTSFKNDEVDIVAAHRLPQRTHQAPATINPTWGSEEVPRAALLLTRQIWHQGKNLPKAMLVANRTGRTAAVHRSGPRWCHPL